MSAAAPGLQGWLDRLQRLHPDDMELGLERVAQVAAAMSLDLSMSRVVVVAGTNGKGSTVAALQAIALRHGLSVGAYTSPHLLRFNERIQLDGRQADDRMLCHAFDAVERCRGDTRLTYFEFTTLAALYCFQCFRPHWCLLEVGLGGRLDAVNIVDADVAIVTNIQLDHQAWLGRTRDAIAAEKAGIFRADRPAICAERRAPATLGRVAADLGAQWLQRGEAFDLVAGSRGWRWQGRGADGSGVRCEAEGTLQLEHGAVAAAIQAAWLLLPEPQAGLVADAVADVRLTARCQTWQQGQRSFVLDVSHNAAAAGRLARVLAAQPVPGATHLILAVLEDKDVGAIVAALQPAIDGSWYLPELGAERALSATAVAAALAALSPAPGAVLQPSVDAALEACLAQSRAGDRIVVSGSFYTVADAMTALAGRGIGFE